MSVDFDQFVLDNQELLLGVAWRHYLVDGKKGLMSVILAGQENAYDSFVTQYFTEKALLSEVLEVEVDFAWKLVEEYDPKTQCVINFVFPEDNNLLTKLKATENPAADCYELYHETIESLFAPEPEEEPELEMA